MPAITAFLVDAFTQTPGEGNRAGVVLDAAGLSDTAMQEIARLVNVSETAFVLPPDGPGHTVKVRYFTPTREVPICGHATIATHYLRALQGNLPTSHLVARTGAGDLPVDIYREDNSLRIIMTQGAPSLEPPLAADIQDAMRSALGLSRAECPADLPVQIASTGHSKVMVPVLRTDTVNRLKPDMARLAAVSRAIHCNGFFTFALDAGGGHLYAGRMFAPEIGIGEDPVTGNANGPAGYYLFTHGVLRTTPGQDTLAYQARQGETMGKPGVIDVILHLNQGHVTKVQVAGTAVAAGEMVFELAVREIHHRNTTFYTTPAP